MKKIAFLRSLEVQQAAPFLMDLDGAAGGAELKLFYTHGECTQFDFPGTSEKLVADVTAEDLVERLLAWGAEGVISLSLPDENTVRDSLVKAILEPLGVPVLISSPDAVRVLSDKWETKVLLERYGVLTPPGIPLDGDLMNGRGLSMPAYKEYVRWKAHELGFPLMVKPLWDCMGHGIQFLESTQSLEDYLVQPHTGNTVLEKCVSGELCSVEIIGTQGQYLVQPLCWMGYAGGPVEFAFGQVRYCGPRPHAAADFAPVAASLTEMLSALGVEGAVCVDMIYEEGNFHILEVNPRVSGATSLGIVSSGNNTFTCLLDVLLGRWTEKLESSTDQGNVALQFPTLTISASEMPIVTDVLDVVRANVFHVDGEAYPNMLIRVRPDAVGKLPDVIASLNSRINFLRSSVGESIAAVAAAVTRQATEAAHVA